MRKISTRIKRILTSNLGLKIVSVLVACMMWIFVVNVDDPEKVQSFSDVKVEIRNSDCFGVDKTFSVQEDTDKVKVWVKARASVLNKLQSKDFKVVADMRNVTLGNAVPYTLECTSSALTKANWECEPASLKIKIENVVQESFGVEVDTTGEPADGYDIGTSTIKEGDTINIAGAESLMNIIHRVSMSVSVNGLSSDKTVKGNIVVTDKNGTDFTQSQLDKLVFTTSSGDLIKDGVLSAKIQLWKVEQNVKVNIGTYGDPAPGYCVSEVKVTPENISIAGDEETLAELKERQREELEKKELLLQLKGKENITLDGKKIMLYANIGNIKDLATVVQNDAGGIGLFRSEFIYLEKEDYPTEEEQFKIYKTAVETMAGKRVIIRTLDIGADKQCDYFKMEKEENPALGYRAIRICLTQTEIFKTQLRALFRASAYGNLAIMYPMITSLWEVKRIKEIVEEVKAELTAEEIEFGNPQQGIMIETPAAVMVSGELAKEVDFFSIGTNDLTQYTLAIDRQNPKLDLFYNAHHPAVLSMIKMTVENAHKAGIWAGICGELGADTSLTKDFLAMGVDELSVSPGSILPIRKIILETNVEEYKRGNYADGETL